jgi:putative transposase
VVTPVQRRSVVAYAKESAAVAERQACRYLGVHRSLCRYRARRPLAAEQELRTRLRELADQHPRWGCPRLYWLLRREGRGDNYKRVERLYALEGLAVRRRSRKRPAVARVPLLAPSGRNERWSMDFVRDTLRDGRVFRAFTLVDDFTREAPVIEVDLSLSGERIVRVLEQLVTVRGTPKAIVCDNGPEFQGRALNAWAYQRGVALQFIRPGKPVENAYIESFNGRFRDECLNQHLFLTLADARAQIEAWRIFYHRDRPHSGLAGRTPDEFTAELTQELQATSLRLSA